MLVTSTPSSLLKPLQIPAGERNVVFDAAVSLNLYTSNSTLLANSSISFSDLGSKLLCPFPSIYFTVSETLLSETLTERLFSGDFTFVAYTTLLPSAKTADDAKIQNE